jgi:hypothetical protein
MKRDKKKGPTFAEHISALKQPKTAQQIAGKKAPVIAEPVPLYNEEKAAWRISRIQLIAPYGFRELDVEGISRVKERLGALERNSWKDIFIRDKHYNHQIEVDELKCAIAKKWMEDNLPDQHSLWTIRVTGKERIWGILAEGAYQIVFWDPEHLIWEVPKK